MTPAADTKGFTLQVGKEGFGDLNAVAEHLNSCPRCPELYGHTPQFLSVYVCVD